MQQGKQRFQSSHDKIASVSNYKPSERNKNEKNLSKGVKIQNKQTEVLELETNITGIKDSTDHLTGRMEGLRNKSLSWSNPQDKQGEHRTDSDLWDSEIHIHFWSLRRGEPMEPKV